KNDPETPTASCGLQRTRPAAQIWRFGTDWEKRAFSRRDLATGIPQRNRPPGERWRGRTLPRLSAPTQESQLLVLREGWTAVRVPQRLSLNVSSARIRSGTSSARWRKP